MEINISKNNKWLTFQMDNKEVTECMIVGIEYENRYVQKWEDFKRQLIEELSKAFHLIGRIDALDESTKNYIIDNCKVYHYIDNQSIIFTDTNQNTALKYAFCEGLNAVLNETYIELMDSESEVTGVIANMKPEDIYTLPNFQGEILLTGDDTLLSIRLRKNELAYKIENTIINMVQEVCQKLNIMVDVVCEE